VTDGSTEVRFVGRNVYRAPAGAELPKTADPAAEGWLLIGQVEDDGAVTDTRRPPRGWHACSPYPITGHEPPIRFTNRAARRAAKRGNR